VSIKACLLTSQYRQLLLGQRSLSLHLHHFRLLALSAREGSDDDDDDEEEEEEEEEGGLASPLATCSRMHTCRRLDE
jgi:hypothetical protein